MMHKVVIYSFLLLSFIGCRENLSSPITDEEQQTWQRPEEVYGQFFIDVQTAPVFPDSKTFVDCVPKMSAAEILANYEAQKTVADFDLKAFVLEYFELPKQYATDFQSDTSRDVQAHINVLWDVLTREADQAAPGSLIALPKSYIVPGGRFGEVYYWDSYFTMLGLGVADKWDMIENMADNFAYVIDTVGHIPNGNRTYYLSRSQPPFFAQIVHLLAEEKGENVLEKYLPALKKEYAFWTKGIEKVNATNRAHRRVVWLEDNRTLARYCDDLDIPRQEAYKEDIAAAAGGELEAEVVYKHLRSGAESGWDFSSRWFEDAENIETIETTDIIPVDLNALIYSLEMTLSQAARANNNQQAAQEYAQLAARRKAAVLDYCWDEASGAFRDYDYVEENVTPVVSLATSYPLFFEMATQAQADAVAETLERDFLKLGGVVSTLNATGEQWDAPNGWAPLQWLTIQGLRNYGHDELAEEIARRWIDLNIKVYKNTGKLVEKYNVMDMTLEAGGGEYPVQDGFGWTNGVLLKLMDIYEDR
ncbi:MAG: alpha,alpha-trehalase TreF [Bacteroidota bacterium]